MDVAFRSVNELSAETIPKQVKTIKTLNRDALLQKAQTSVVANELPKSLQQKASETSID